MLHGLERTKKAADGQRSHGKNHMPANEAFLLGCELINIRSHNLSSKTKQVRGFTKSDA